MSLEMMDLRVPKDHLEDLDLMDLVDLLESQEKREVMEPLVWMDHQVSLVMEVWKDQEDTLDKRVSLAHLDFLVLMVLKVRMVDQALLVQLVSLEQRELLE